MHSDSAASRTALMVAGYRARATARERPICADPWAMAIAGEEGIELANRMDKNFASFELWIALRTAFLDRQIERWTGPGHDVEQVVLLGAGFDTRAARLRRDGVRFFEVDHPATQADKRRRLATLAGYPVDAAEYAPCDFESQDFLDSLIGSGFDASAPALILWEGVTAYLSEETVRATARRIASGCDPRSVLIFDLVGKRLTSGTNLSATDLGMRDYVGDLGEPLRWGSDNVLPLLYDEGYRAIRVLTFDDICLALTGTYDRAHKFFFQRVALASALGSNMQAL